MNIPFHKPHITESAIESVVDVLRSGWITTGPKVKEFEQMFVESVGGKYSLAVSSCTAALHLAYVAHGFGPGDEIIVPSFTFCSTINTIIHVGATPVFCDIQPESLCLDPLDVKKRITKNTKAIVVVHYAGMPADMDAINLLAKEHGIVVIEDAAHAFMTKYKGKYVGDSVNTTCFSFYATKNLTTAEGGMVVTADPEIAKRVEIMRMHGISKEAWNRYSNTGSWKYDVLEPGYKYNMPDISAALGIDQLQGRQNSQKRRERLALKYMSLLSSNQNLVLPNFPKEKDSKHAWHLFTIQLKNSSPLNRDELVDKLKENGIGTSVHFIPNHQQSYYRSRYGEKTLPVTEKVFSQILSLPFYEDLSEEEITYITENVNKFLS